MYATERTGKYYRKYHLCLVSMSSRTGKHVIKH